MKTQPFNISLQRDWYAKGKEKEKIDLVFDEIFKRRCSTYSP